MNRLVLAGVAEVIAKNFPNFARLPRTPSPAGPPLLPAAFCYFCRREVETNDELAHGLFFDGLRQLSASQAKAFGEVGKALTSLGGQFDALFEQLGRIEAAVEETHAVAVETHGAVLDIQTELQRSHGEARTLMEQVLLRLGQVGMARGEVRLGNRRIMVDLGIVIMEKFECLPIFFHIILAFGSARLYHLPMKMIA